MKSPGCRTVGNGGECGELEKMAHLRGGAATHLLSTVARGECRSNVARLSYISIEAGNLGFYVKYQIFKHWHLIYMNTYTQSSSQI